MHSISGKGAVVTGAAGDIGAAIARQLLLRGARVHVTDADAARLETRMADLVAIGTVTSSACDLADPQEVRQLADAALAALGTVDILINNAAIQAQGGMDSCTQDLFDLAHAVNVRAPFLLAQAVLPSMRGVGGGAIVNISSVHATAPGPQRIAYATTKTALLGLTRAMAADLGPDNIRVNAVSPGATLTSQLAEAWTALSADGTDIMGHAERQHPLRRIAAAEDIAEAVAYLCEAGFVTGTELRVDGGLLSSLRLLPQK